MSDHGHSPDQGHGHGDVRGGGFLGGLLHGVGETLSPEFLAKHAQEVADEAGGIGGQGANAAVKTIEGTVRRAASMGSDKAPVEGGGGGGGGGGAHHH